MLKKIRQNCLRKKIAALAVLGMVFFDLYPLYDAIAADLTTLTVAGTFYESNKGRGPSVNVNFSSNGGIREGARITATATPSGFSDNSSDLYFTWYLKQEDCEENETSDGCDLDGNGDYDYNDWKIAAARIIIQGDDFDRSEINGYSSYSSGFDEDAAGVEASPALSEWDGDDGDDVDDNVPYCYIQDEESGKIYELTATDRTCCSGGDAVCVDDVEERCTEVDEFGVETVTTYDNVCEAVGVSDIGVDTDEFTAEFRCSGEGQTAVCMSSDRVTDLTDGNYLILNRDSSACAILGSNPGYIEGCEHNLTNTTNLEGIVEVGFFTTEKNLFDVIYPTGSQPSCTFRKADGDYNLCGHLFPKYENNIHGIDLGGQDVGDGEFTLEEKEFWGADPRTTATNGRQKDEAAVMGLGVDRITWTYAEGDEMGVVVEGETHRQTEHNDSGYMRMWAFSGGTCSALKDAEKSFYIEPEDVDIWNNNAQEIVTGIRTVELNLNDCLEENLLDPSDSVFGGDPDLEVSAASMNLVNDPDGINSSTARLTALMRNISDPSRLYYEWTVERSRDGENIPSNATSWENITNRITDHSELAGVGRNSLNFLLNFDNDIVDLDDDTFYLRVTSSALISSDEFAKGSVILKVDQLKNNGQIYAAVADENGKLSFTSNHMCSSTADAFKCGVVKNEIVGIRISGSGTDRLSGVQWTVNGTPLACTSAISNDCDSDGNTLFFPVLGEPGDMIIVTATGVKGNGEAVEIKEHFVISDNEVNIVPSGEGGESVWPKLIGYSKNPDGSRGEPDYSSKVFETHMENHIVLSASGIPQGYNISWTLDGIPQDDYFSKPELVFDVLKKDGENYSVSVIPIYDPSQQIHVSNTRKALAQHWGVTVSNDISMENVESANVQINVVDTPNLIGSKDGPILANLATHLPGQIVFLLELTLTAFALLMFSGLLFAIVPESMFSKRQMK